MKNLATYRNNRKTWIDFAFTKTHTEERGTYDKNEKDRYAILIEIQYDFKNSDEEFIRYLFEQEIIARENDSFQGIGDGLWLGAYLLAKFKKPDDIQLFYNAKFANFDTGCGFDREFMFLSLKEKTEEFVFKNHPEMYDEVKDLYETFDLESWWLNLSRRYPENEADEPPLKMYYRNIDFGKIDIAKNYLEKWKENEPDSKEKDNTLKHAYIELGEISKAIDLTKKEFVEKETHWDRASYYRDLLALYIKSKNSKDGFKVIKSIDNEFNQFDDWKRTGLGRMAIHEVFKFVLISDAEEAKTAFFIADKWYKETSNIAFIGLEAGLKAAKKCGFSDDVKTYKKLLQEENERINNL